MTDIDRDKPAYVMASGSVPEGQTGGGVVTYGELEHDSNRLAQLLATRGLAFGDHIAIFMDNNERYLEVAWAAQRSGLFYTRDQLPLQRRGGRVHPRRLRREGAVRRRRAGRRVVRPGSGDAAEVWRPRSSVGGARRRLRGSRRRSSGGIPAEPLAEELEGTPMLYSSGTTGRPKGIKYPTRRQAVGPTPTRRWAMLMTIFGIDGDTRVPLARAAVPLGAAAVLHA